MESTQDVTSFDVEENPVSDPREDYNKIKTFFKEKIEPLLGLFLIIFDYIYDLNVGIGLYRDTTLLAFPFSLLHCPQCWCFYL